MIEARPAYPPTAVRAVQDTLHGTALTDSYRWLENGEAADVEAWTAAQNGLTRSVLDAFPGRATLTAAYEKLFAVNTAIRARPHGDPRCVASRADGAANGPPRPPVRALQVARTR